MNFKLGEFVRFIDENREGYITRIIDEQIVGVTGDDDFEIPVAVTNLARVHGHPSSTIEEDLTQPVEISLDNFKEKGIYLAVIPDANKGSLVHFFVVNETSFQLFVTLNTEVKDKFKGEFSGNLNPQSVVKIHTAALPELDIWPKYIFRILPYTAQNIKPVKCIATEQKFRAKDFSGSKQTVPFIKQQGWLIQLDEAELKIDAQKLKESFFNKPAKEEKQIAKPNREVDLHIEKIRNDYQFLSKSEILEIQLAEFHKNLDAAITHKLPEIVFIHGVGNGVLKNHIHKTVSKHPQVRTFKDAQKEKFGFGATEVVLK